MRIEDDGNLKVTVNIREQDILKISEGMNARITCDAVGSDQVFSGQVIRVINFASASGGSDARRRGWIRRRVQRYDFP